MRNERAGRDFTSGQNVKCAERSRQRGRSPRAGRESRSFIREFVTPSVIIMVLLNSGAGCTTRRSGQIEFFGIKEGERTLQRPLGTDLPPAHLTDFFSRSTVFDRRVSRNGQTPEPYRLLGLTATVAKFGILGRSRD